jgi:hypothetical protein
LLSSSSTSSDIGTVARRDELKAELVRIEAELARYAEAIADAGPLDTILQAIKIREHRRDALRAELKALIPLKPREVDGGGIRATLSQYLKDWTAMARAGVVETRRLLREVLVDRIVSRPVPRPPDLPPVKGPGRRPRLVYEFAGEASLSKLFADLIYEVRWWPQRDSNPCLPSATRFLNLIGELHDVDSTPHPPGFKFGSDFSPPQTSPRARSRQSLAYQDSSETFPGKLGLGPDPAASARSNEPKSVGHAAARRERAQSATAESFSEGSRSLPGGDPALQIEGMQLMTGGTPILVPFRFTVEA